MNENFNYPSDRTGEKSFVWFMMFLITGIPLAALGAFLIWILTKVNKPIDGNFVFLGIAGTFCFLGGLWCMKRSLEYATGRAQPFLPEEGRNGPVVVTFIAMAPLLRLVNTLDRIHPLWFSRHTWVMPIAMLSIVSTPFIAWWWNYRWKRK